MDIKKKFKDMWRKVKGEKSAKKTAPRRAAVDAEISVEEVTREEIFPEGKRKVTVKAASSNAKKTAGKPTAKTQKPLSERTRPTNPDYKMIDPSGSSCDTSKS